MKTIKSPAAAHYSVLKQICNFIPGHLVSRLARQTGADKKARGFSNWSHVVGLLFAQLAHSIGLNDSAMPYSHNRSVFPPVNRLAYGRV
ncbi:MAG: DUF4372 domain-containing protein [Limisphaerales bacterium]